MRYRHCNLLLLFLLTALIAAAGAFAQSTLSVTGRVFDDTNANGKLDPGEKGLAGVRVSDGLRVIRTGRDGAYRFDDVNRESYRFVFVVVPSGRRASAGFYRSLPTDAAAFEADFALAPCSKSANPRFSFGQTADIHVTGDGDAEDLAADLAEVAGCGAAFVLAAGDLVNDGVNKPEQLDNYKNGITRSPVPVYNAPGNHDIGGKGRDPQNYEARLGPVYYSFDYGGCHFVAINSTDFGDAQRQWLENDLREAGGAPVLAFQHYHPDDGILRKLAQHNGLALFTGHWHTAKVFPYQPSRGAKRTLFYVNTPPLRFGGIDTSPRGFLLVHINRGRMTLEHRYGGLRKHLAVSAPADGSEIPAGAFDIRAAAYDSATLLPKVDYRLDDGPWSAMKRAGSMSFSARHTVAPGSHTLTVRAVFSGGEAVQKQCAFTVSSSSRPVPRAGCDWPMFKRDAERRGVSADAVQPPLRLSWSTALGGTIHVGGPVVAGDTVYVGAADDDCTGRSGVYALDVRDGAVKWHYPTRGPVKNSVAVADGCVYAMSVDGEIAAIDAATGRKRFSYQLSGVGHWLFASPVVRDGVLYAGSGAELVALDAKTGREIWISDDMGSDWISCFTSPAASRGKVIMGLNWSNGLFGLDSRTGRQLWNAKKGFGTSHCTPAVADGVVYHAADSSLYALDAARGEVIWSFPLPGGWPLSSPAVADGRVVVGGPDGSIYCLDSATGRQLWSAKTGRELLFYRPYGRTGNPVVSSPAVSGNVAYCGGVDGRFYALDMVDGRELWSYDLGVPVTASAAVSGNAVYAAAYDGTVYAFVQLQ